MDPAVKAAIATIPDDAWEMIEYTDAIRDETTGQLISKAEVAEVPFTAFRSRKKAEQVAGRLVVRRIPDLNPRQVEQPTLFDVYRHHAFFTTTAKEVMDTVAADKTHRGHAIIEQVHADLKAGPLAHLPSGVFTANSAWLVLAVARPRTKWTTGMRRPELNPALDASPRPDHAAPAHPRLIGGSRLRVARYQSACHLVLERIRTKWKRGVHCAYINGEDNHARIRDLPRRSHGDRCGIADPDPRRHRNPPARGSVRGVPHRHAPA